MAQGAHRGRPVAAAPCTPGLRPAKSPLRGTFDLSLQAAGRAEAASVQNTALSPHPCGLPRPSGNVSAILRPSAPAVSATMVNKLTAGRTNPRPGKRSATRYTSGSAPAALAGRGVLSSLLIGKWRCRPGKRSANRHTSGSAPAVLARRRGACRTWGVTQVGKSRTGRTNPVGRVRRQPPPGTKAAPRPLSLPGGAALAGPTVLNNLLIYKWLCRPGQAQPPPGTKAAPRPLPLPGGAALAGPTVMNNLLIYKWLCRPGKRSATRQIFA